MVGDAFLCRTVFTNQGLRTVKHVSLGVLVNMAPTENTRRKARVSGVEKYIKKYGSKLLFQYGPPVLRYSLVPGMILYAMYYTEPDPTLMDMLWPLPI